MQKAKWLSGEALQIAVKRREVKSKGEKERYIDGKITTIAREKAQAKREERERNGTDH